MASYLPPLLEDVDIKAEKKRKRDVLEAKMSLADGPALRPDGPRSGLSAVVARTVRARAESVRVPSFSRICYLKPRD